MGYWENGVYKLSSDGQIPALSQEKIDAIILTDNPPSIWFNTDKKIIEWINEDVIESLTSNNIFNLIKEPSGFVHPNEMIVTFDDVTHKVTVSTADSVNYPVQILYKGLLVKDINESSHLFDIALDDTVSQKNFLYYDNNGLYFSDTIWTFDKVQIATVKYNHITDTGIILRETHGTMPYQTHDLIHNIIGTYLSSGGDISQVVENSTVPDERRPYISESIIADEDLKTVLPILNTANNYTHRKFIGTEETIVSMDKNNTDIIKLNGSIPSVNRIVNKTWVQEDFQDDEYGKVFLMIVPSGLNSTNTNSQDVRFQFIQPQLVSTNKSVIEAITPSDIILGESDVLTAEYVMIAEFIIHYISGDWKITDYNKLKGSKISQYNKEFMTNVITDDTLTGNGVTVPLGINEIKLPLITDAGMNLTTNKINSKIYWNTDKLKYVYWVDDHWEAISSILTEAAWDLLAGTDFEDGNFVPGTVLVNDNAGNDGFIVGTSFQYEGSYSLYGRRNGGDNNDYNNNIVYHLYLDVPIPGTVSDWRVVTTFKCDSENGYDGAQVFICDPSITPVAGTELVDNGSTIIQIGDTPFYDNEPVFRDEIVNCPVSFIGNTARIVLSFTSDGSINSDNGYSALVMDNFRIETKTI